MEGLQKSLSALPMEPDANKRLSLKLGPSAEKVSIQNLINLLLIAYQRINIDIEDVNIDEMVKQNQPFLESLRNPPKDEDTASLIVLLIQDGYYQIVEKFYHFGAKIDILAPNGDNILEIALNNKDELTISSLLSLGDPFINKALAEVKLNHTSMMRKLINFGGIIVYRALFANKEFVVPFFNQSLIIQRALQMIDKNDNDGYYVLMLVCGPSLPDYLIECQKKENDRGIKEILKKGLSDRIDSHKIRERFNNLPGSIYLSNLKKQ